MPRSALRGVLVLDDARDLTAGRARCGRSRWRPRASWWPGRRPPSSSRRRSTSRRTVAPVRSGVSPLSTTTSSGVAGHGRDGRPERIAGALRRVLDDPVDGRRRRPRGRASLAGETTTSGRSGRVAGGVDDVGQHGPAAERVEDLGAPRSHPGAEPGGEDDDGGRRRASRHRAGVPVRAWAGSVGIRWTESSADRRGVSTAAGPRHRRQPRARRTAMASISTRPPFGRAATAKVERAGGGSPKKVA